MRQAVSKSGENTAQAGAALGCKMARQLLQLSMGFDLLG